MLPSISPLSAGSVPLRAASAQMSPPLRFRKPDGQPYKITIAPAMKRKQEAYLSSSQKEGLRYERKVLKYLTSLFGASFIPGPVLRYFDSSGVRMCVPDGWILGDNQVCIVEVKTQHCAEAWWQLNLLYRPVVEALYPMSKVRMLEVCKVFDPATLFPVPCEPLDDVVEFIQAGEPNFGVFRWRG